jgi:hypothetical protein
MQWIAEHLRLLEGIMADGLTFAGALVLARDGFQRLKDFYESEIDLRFRRQFPELNMADAQERQARVSARWAVRGLLLLAAGFILEIAARCLEAG